VRWDAVRRRITIRVPAGWTGSETITFTATDPTGLSDSDPATYTVNALGGPSSGPIKDEEGRIPQATELLGNYPNPFNPSTVISYATPKDAHVRINVYNMIGEVVATLVDERHAAGSYTVVFNAGSLPSGVYIYELDVEGSAPLRRKALFLK